MLNHEDAKTAKERARRELRSLLAEGENRTTLLVIDSPWVRREATRRRLVPEQLFAPFASSRSNRG